METIQIRRKVYTDISFNSHGFEKTVEFAFPKLENVESKLFTHYVSIFFHKLSEFDTKSEDNLIRRNIVRQQLVNAVVTSGDPKDIIQSNVVILGKTRNWPTYKDVIITDFENRDFHFTNLKNHNELLMSIKMAYFYLGSQLPPIDKLDLISTLPVSRNIKRDVLPPFDMKHMSSIVEIVKNVYLATLETKNYLYMHVQLKSAGLIDAIYYSIHDKKPELNKLLQTRINQTKYEYMSKNEQYNKILHYSEFHLVTRILNEEFDEPGKYLDLIHKKKIKSTEDFYKLIPEKDKIKIQKLVGDRNKRIYAKACIHDSALRKYSSLYKVITKWAEDERQKAKQELDPLIEFDETTKQYHCKTCSQRVICQHTFDLSGKDYKTKTELVEQYREPVDSSKKYSYCKYCHEQIARNELEEIMTEVKFEEIVRSRQQTMEGDTQTASFENGLYFGVSNAVNALIFKYEFPVRTFVKTIMNIIYNLVYSQVAKLKIENDLEIYENTAGLYGYIYTAIYMLKLFLVDPKITTSTHTPKTDSEYAKYFMTKILQRFNQITSHESAKKIMYQAYIDLKPVSVIELQGKDENDKLLEILQHPLFVLLYKMHLCANPTHSTIDAYKYIVTQVKPDVTNFHIGAKIPKANVGILADLYTYWLDYSSPFCYIFSTGSRPTGAADVVYDSTLYNKLMKNESDVFKQVGLTRFMYTVKPKISKIFSSCYGANYIYDDEGDMITWDIDLTWKTKSGKVIKYSDIKKHIDDSTPAKLQKRNEKIGFKLAKFKKSQLLKYKFISLEEPPKYEFDKKLTGIISKIDHKYSPYILEYLGRSEGYDYAELIRGIIPNVENYSSGYTKIKYYCQLFIEQYYNLKNDPMNEDNVELIEKAGIDFSKVSSVVEKFPELNVQEYYNNTNNYINLFTPEKFYFWQVEALTKFIITAEKVDKLGHAFAEKFIRNIINIEKKLSLPNPKKLAGGFVSDALDESEYDESKDVTYKKNKTSSIDYEQDEDDVNDR